MDIAGELRIITDHYKHRIRKRTKPLTIHTEAIYKDSVWKKVQEFVSAGRQAIWFVITPVNYDFAKAEFGCSLPKDRYERILLERYRWLRDHGQEIQIHVHLRVRPELYETEDEARQEQEQKIRAGAGWLRKNGFTITKVVFGWWSYNELSVGLAQAHGLEVVKRADYYFIHDFDLVVMEI